MLSTTETPRELRQWWLDAPDYSARFDRSPPDARYGCYRFGDGYLEIDSNCSSLLDILRDVYGDCSVARPPEEAAVRLSCSVLRIPDPPLTLLRFHREAPPRPVEHALSMLHYLHLDSPGKFLEVGSEVPGWRFIARADSPEQPVLAASRTDLLVDRTLEFWRFTVSYLVSTIMSLQRDVAFVHAGSAGVRGVGVLLAGPSRSGKTTLSLALASRGHTFFGENIAAISKVSKTLLPFRRVGYVRSGPRARTVDDSLTERRLEPELVALGAAPTEPRIPVRVSEVFPNAGFQPVPLGSAYFLGGFAERPRVEAFIPSLADVEKTLKPITYDFMVATSWGLTPGSWLLKYLGIIELLSKIRCYRLDVGPPDETADLIENNTEGSWA